MKTVTTELDGILEDFHNRILNSNIDWNLKPEPEKWSAKQILGHLVDSANNNIQRFVRGTYELDFKIIYNQNEWVDHQHYDKCETDDLIHLWVLMNKQIVRILNYYPENRMSVKSDIGNPEIEMKSMTEIATGYVEHLKHHLNQIRNAHSV